MSQSNAVETTTNASKKSLVEILAIGYLLALAIEMHVLNLIVWPTITVGLYAWHKRGTV